MCSSVQHRHFLRRFLKIVTVAHQRATYIANQMFDLFSFFGIDTFLSMSDKTNIIKGVGYRNETNNCYTIHKTIVLNIFFTIIKNILDIFNLIFKK